MAVVEIDPDRLAVTSSGPGLVLVECWAPGCGACRQFDPVFDRVAGRHPDHTFARLDITAEQGLSEALQVEHTPALMVYRDGTLLFRQAGNFPESELEGVVAQAAALDMAVVRADIEADRAGNTPKEDGGQGA